MLLYRGTFLGHCPHSTGIYLCYNQVGRHRRQTCSTTRSIEGDQCRGLDSVETTGEKAACLHDATPAFDHEDNLDGQCDKNKEILERTGLPSDLWKIF